MWTVISKILNFISSCSLLYPLLMLRVIFLEPPEGSTRISEIKANLVLLVILFALFIVGIVWLVGMLRWKNNTRISGQSVNNITIEMAAFLATYLVPLIFIDVNWLGLTICAVVFVVVGIIFVCAENHFLNPMFLLFGYKLYKVDEKCILSKASLDGLKLQLLENQNGICVRELVRNTYIVLSK